MTVVRRFDDAGWLYIIAFDSIYFLNGRYTDTEG
jgi:hypothetical protein